MTRIALILCFALLVAGSAQADSSGAESSQDRLITALQADGYVIVQTERTWLGRLRIVATKGDLRREVVINPGTGEVLRDIASAAAADESNVGKGNVMAGSGIGGADTVSTTATTGTASAPASAAVGVDSGAATSSDSVGATRDVLLPESGVLQ